MGNVFLFLSSSILRNHIRKCLSRKTFHSVWFQLGSSFFFTVELHLLGLVLKCSRFSVLPFSLHCSRFGVQFWGVWFFRHFVLLTINVPHNHPSSVSFFRVTRCVLSFPFFIADWGVFCFNIDPMTTCWLLPLCISKISFSVWTWCQMFLADLAPYCWHFTSDFY